MFLNRGAPINTNGGFRLMAVFGLESTDIAFLGLLFGILSPILAAMTYFWINVAKNMSYLMRYTKEHEIRADKEADILDRVVTKLAVIDSRMRNLEQTVFKRGAPIGDIDNGI